MKSTEKTVQAGIIAALYVTLTILSQALGLTAGPVQIRLSEALCILPCFFPAAIPGLTIGCFIANIFVGGAIWDLVFGSLATLLGSIGTRLWRNNRYMASAAPIISNSLIVPIIISYAYGAKQSLPILFVTVLLSELITCGVLGQIIYMIIKRIQD